MTNEEFQDIPVLTINVYANQQFVAGQFLKGIGAIAVPQMVFRKDETKEKLTELSNDVAKKVYEILEFDNG